MYLHGTTDCAKTLKLRFRVGDLDLPKTRGTYEYTSSREEEEEDAHMRLCSKEKESRTRIAGECGMNKEERDALEEIRQIDECDTEKYSTLDSSEKTIAILGDRW